jgi:hypothetical protein
MATVLPSGPNAAVPVTAIVWPILTALEMPILGSKGDPVEILRRDELDIARVFKKMFQWSWTNGHMSLKNFIDHSSA